MNIMIHDMAAIVVMAVVSYFVKGIAFVVYRKRQVPQYITYIGNVLPFSSMVLLVVYCLKNVDVFAGNHGIPELLSCLIVAGLHIWKKNTVLSVVVGTICYMILIRL